MRKYLHVKEFWAMKQAPGVSSCATFERVCAIAVRPVRISNRREAEPVNRRCLDELDRG